MYSSRTPESRAPSASRPYPVARGAKQVVDRTLQAVFGREHAVDPPRSIDHQAGRQVADQLARVVDGFLQFGRFEHLARKLPPHLLRSRSGQLRSRQPGSSAGTRTSAPGWLSSFSASSARRACSCCTLSSVRIASASLFSRADGFFALALYQPSCFSPLCGLRALRGRASRPLGGKRFW